MNIQLLLALAALCLSSATAASRKISAFNIQIFGRNKASKSDVMDDLVDILKRYDIVLIQEIRDSSGTAIVSLFDLLNAENGVNNAYSMVIGDRVGRSSSKEQYCYFYKKALFTVLRTNEYPDASNGDVFEREPYNVKFQDVDGKVFVLSALHAKPGQAVAELDQMPAVYDYIVSSMGTPNVIMMGDFNADCSYVRRSEWSSIRLYTDSRFTWYIGDDADTTVRTTDCAYDRFVTAGNINVQANSAKVFNFETMDLKTSEPTHISDHYPIELVIL